MSNNLLQGQNIEEIISEIESQYALDNSAVHRIINDSISAVYQSDFPVLLEEDGVYVVYKDKLNPKKIKYVKIKYSKQKSKLILQNIQKKANQVFLEAQRQLVQDFIKTKKNYLHATFSHEINNENIYNLYFDKSFKHAVRLVKAKAPKTCGIKKRIYIDFTSAHFEKGFVFFRELRNYKTLKNTREFTKDISREVYEKIQKRVWIEVKSINLEKRAIYIHLPYKTTLDIIEYIKRRFLEVFELDVALVGNK